MNQVAKEAPPALTTRPSEGGAPDSSGVGGEGAANKSDARVSDAAGGAQPDSGSVAEAAASESDEAGATAEPSHHGREVDELELGALNWRRFAGIGPSEMVELVAFFSSGPRVAYAKNENEYLRLLRQGEQLPGVTGIYQVANQLTERVRHLCRTGSWVATPRRASDAWVAARRVLPIDIDSVRASGMSATDDEKAPCYEAADRIEELLRKFVDPWAIGRGDSGNGLWLFIALERIRCSEAEEEQIAKLLQHLKKTFSTDRVKVDSTVANPSRLVPAFGTMKQKGKPTKERPHRRTTFSCAGTVRRVQLAELFG